MMRLIHGVHVHGLQIGAKTECEHWHSNLDVIAIKFPCCQEFYCCFDCHKSLADHPAKTWPTTDRDRLAILCGNCGHQLTIVEYQLPGDACPNCAAQFNPGCRNHTHLYFENS
ncbi:MAG: CHY zinc finger protein [Fimbriimonadaceae bacterium]